jgi:hypothetical protein
MILGMWLNLPAIAGIGTEKQRFPEEKSRTMPRKMK